MTSGYSCGPQSQGPRVLPGAMARFPGARVVSGTSREERFLPGTNELVPCVSVGPAAEHFMRPPGMETPVIITLASTGDTEPKVLAISEESDGDRQWPLRLEPLTRFLFAGGAACPLTKRDEIVAATPKDEISRTRASKVSHTCFLVQAPVPAPAPDELRPRSCGARGTGAVAPRPRSLSLHHVWHLASMGHPRCFARVATKQSRIQGVVDGPISPNT